MAGNTSGSQLRQKRDLDPDGAGLTSKHARPNPSELLVPSPRLSPGSSTSHTSTTQIDQSLFCERCNTEKYPWHILEEIRRPMCGVWLKKLLVEDWKIDTIPSCPCCELLRYARCIRKENQITNHVAYFYVASDLDERSAEDEPLRVLEITEDFLGLRKPKESCKVFTRAFLEAQNRGLIDLSVFREQIQICQTTHTCYNSQRKYQKVVGLKVIDCQSKDVVPAPDNCKYVALSYVWGSSLDPVGNLQNPPQTISDAMTATLSLGISFLWVDRYCIDQNNPDEKHYQIQQMGFIYSQAEITIVAAAGDGPRHGLPGISIRQPKQGRAIRIGPYTLQPLHMSSQELLARSVWMTRAWTFQEFVLSKRCLIFTDQHAFFHCQTSIMEEWPASAWKYTFSPTAYADMGCNLDTIFPSNQRFSFMNLALEYVQHYCMRQLSFSSDALNGILGVLSIFEYDTTPVYHLWGLPYSLVGHGRDLRIYYSLMWRIRHEETGPDGKSASYQLAVRRTQFPSWSWTGWEGVPLLAKKEIKPFSSLRIDVEKEDGTGLLSLEDFAKRRSSGIPIPASRFLHIQGWTYPVKVAWNQFHDKYSGVGPVVCLPGYMRTCRVNHAACSEQELKSGERKIGSLVALVIEHSSWRKSSSEGQQYLQLHCWVVEKTKTTAERFGVVDLFLDIPLQGNEDFGQVMSKIQTRFPLIRKESLRLG